MVKRRTAGQIIPLDRRRWRIRWSLGRDADGKRQTASEIVRGTKRDAEKRLAEIQGLVERNVRVTTRGRTVREMLEAWRVAEADEGRSKRTWHSYNHVIENHLIPALGHLRVDDLNANLVKSQLLRPLADRPRTAELARAVLQVALRWAAEQKEFGIDSVPWEAGALRLATSTRGSRNHTDRALTTDEVSRFRGAAAGTQHAAVFDVLLGTGLRPSEAAGLQWRDIALSTEDRAQWAQDDDALARQAAKGEGACLLVRRTLADRSVEPWEPHAPVFNDPKTAAGVREIPLAKPLVRTLRGLRAKRAEERLRGQFADVPDHDLVFVGRDDAPLNVKSLSAAFRRIAARAGLPKSATLYCLRHTGLTTAVDHAVSTGAGLGSVARIAGHKSPDLTLRVYTSPTEEGKRALVDAMGASLLGS
jgi:integrase